MKDALKEALKEAQAAAFSNRVERDNAEDFASEIADDLRKMRERCDWLEGELAKADEWKAHNRALREMLTVERERCALVALEQRCERGTAWDLACVEIAKAIMRAPVYENVKGVE